MSEEVVNQKAFVKKLDISGVSDLQTALNVLAIYNSFINGETVLGSWQVGLTHDRLVAAIHYILLHHHAADPIYQCFKCRYCNDMVCTSPNPCTFEEITNEV